jgi:hypothetical protein
MGKLRVLFFVLTRRNGLQGKGLATGAGVDGDVPGDRFTVEILVSLHYRSAASC